MNLWSYLLINGLNGFIFYSLRSKFFGTVSFFTCYWIWKWIMILFNISLVDIIYILTHIEIQIDAHRAPLATIVLSSNGMYIATASEQGTIIRVLNYITIFFLVNFFSHFAKYRLCGSIVFHNEQQSGFGPFSFG